MIAAPYWRRPHVAKSKKSIAKTARKRTTQSKSKPQAARSNSKQATLIEMLKRPDGATIEEIAKKLEWQPHTVRGAIAGALKKNLGLDVTSEKDEKRGRIFRITS
jgi:DNA-binding MarR family transcriptional regulator